MLRSPRAAAGARAAATSQHDVACARVSHGPLLARGRAARGFSSAKTLRTASLSGCYVSPTSSPAGELTTRARALPEPGQAAPPPESTHHRPSRRLAPFIEVLEDTAASKARRVGQASTGCLAQPPARICPPRARPTRHRLRSTSRWPYRSPPSSTRWSTPSTRRGGTATSASLACSCATTSCVCSTRSIRSAGRPSPRDRCDQRGIRPTCHLCASAARVPQVHELAGAFYYLMAKRREARGCAPDLEAQTHAGCAQVAKVALRDRVPRCSADPTFLMWQVADDELAEMLSAAPLAVRVVYEASLVDMQRHATLQATRHRPRTPTLARPS